VFDVTFLLGQKILAFHPVGRGFNLREFMNANVEQITTLTERQRQVASLACQGLTNKKIAEHLGLVEGTVKVHLNAVYEKLGVHSRTRLIARFGLQQVAV
jgi:DNA-binding NarL/FixJ family response regulator